MDENGGSLSVTDIKYTISPINDNDAPSRNFVVKPTGMGYVSQRITTNSQNGICALYLGNGHVATDQKGKTFFSLPVGEYSITI